MSGRTPGMALFAAVALLGCEPVPTAPAGAQGRAPAAEIVHFQPPAGVLMPGDTAASALVVRNAGLATHTFWIGYSVMDPAGRWHDVAPSPVPLAAGARSAANRLAWVVPADSARAGPHRVVTAVWDRAPGTEGAVRLAGEDRLDAFSVETRPGWVRLAQEWWEATSHPLGRGVLRPEHVLPGAPIRLRLPAGRCDGAEIRTERRVLHGEYGVRMRTPHAPGSVSAFFLYQDVPGGNDEIDIEIFNDGSRRALLVVWVAGKVTREAEVVLPFDPAADFHEYAIRFASGSVQFRADGKLLGEWTTGLPTRPMRLFVNAWWPAWLPCAPGPDRALLVESGWVR